MVCSKVEISKKLSEKVVQSLQRKENKSESWLLIECLFLHFAIPRYEITIDFLKKAVQYASSERVYNNSTGNE